MDAQHKAIRALLTAMSPKRAIAYIQSFDLPAEEQLYLIECDVRRKSCVQTAQDNKTTPEVVKRRRRSAYAHIADEINHREQETK